MKALVFFVSVPQWLALQVLGRVQRRLFYSGPLATVRLVDIPEPELPSPEWVGIKTLMTGFCASDLNLLMLKDSPTASPFASFPAVMGHEICGEIAEMGADVDGMAVGDRVAVAPGLSCIPRGIEPVCGPCASGIFAACENYAEGNLAPGMFIGICSQTGGGFSPYLVAHKSQIFKLPPGTPPRVGALVEPLSVALQAVANNMPETGDQVLVIGGGVIGSLIVQAIRALDMDCTITVAEKSTFAADLCKEVGADRVITDGDILGHAVEITGAVRYKPMMGPDLLMGGFDRIFDAVANSATLNTAMRCLKAQGVISQVGIGHNVKLDLTPLWLKMQTIKGVYGCSHMTYEGEKRHMFEVAIDLVSKKKVNLAHMVTHTFVLDDFKKMIETNMSKESHRAVKTAVTFET
ncbi:MAG: alcohol dehydrogenase catalytic domain-containing protein [Deltaproteobacteria bacterium]|nr:alcohol dehydrogenase catalytic domain-containing protein [Deltaproteobacteria bacterium]MBW1925416.1 alcohol dehydrogenase catalytic domain-containing protein [Deltaproteobacteria bacterium]MBW1950995.1 alcohol dehydrogenase catalytic domain-containing protein [Deltaproteobacteria bacterium]MBW2009901.1 alcohol dehydrogenase catalytic domain-containing protein [Deltaproteobacteria bacterium]MBW2349221.1 alcohol dehydrogenase catalytic domain-containing protein [Deltaproteobacteria bacterium